jgi:hypothetical protein
MGLSFLLVGFSELSTVKDSNSLKLSFPVRILHSLLHAGCSENTYRLILSGGVDSELSLISTEKPRRLRHRK